MREIVTGVIHNAAAMWLQEDLYNAIDLDYEEHCANCPNDDHDECYESSGDETLLIGFVECETEGDAWYKVGGIFYTIDKAAEYSAICGVPYTQVVRSRWVAECMRCSPCYPGQGDLDTPGSDYLAYCLPPSMFDPEDEFDVSRIKEIESCD